MKKFLLIVCCFVLPAWMFVGSCKKSSDTPAGGTGAGIYYMKFKANGVQKEYFQNTAGNFNRAQSTVGRYGSSFGGTKEPFVATKDNMSVLLVTSGLSLQNVGYVNYATTAAGLSKAYSLVLAHYEENGVFYSSWSDDFVLAIPPGTETNVKLTITAATATTLKGTFSGILYNNDFSKKLAITDGDFFIELK